MLNPATNSLDGGSVTLLDRLANDESLRSALECDPVGTFAQLGIEIDPADVPDTVTLPSRESLGRERTGVVRATGAACWVHLCPGHSS